MTEETESVFNYKGTLFRFSKDRPSHPHFLALLSESRSDDLYEPYECATPSGRLLYLSCNPQPIVQYQPTKVYSPAFLLLWHLITSYEPVLTMGLKRIEAANKFILERGSGITNTLTHCINKVFSMADVDGYDLYSSLELKPIKRERWILGEVGTKRIRTKHFLRPTVSATIEYIDQNVKNFIKNDRIYAGLSFLRDLIPSLKYGFGVYEPSDKVTGPTEIIFYTSHIYWRFMADGVRGDDDDCGIDSGHILNKIVESLLLLLSYSGCAEPVVDIYQELQKGIHIRLGVDCLVRLTEALLKHGEIEALELAIAQLKTMEPQHPIIEMANRSIRRTRAFQELGKAIDMDLSNIHMMEGIDFERFLETQFIKNGFKVERTKASGDFGADLIIETLSGTRVAVQAKRFKQKTNLKAVQEVVASLSHYAADFGIVIAASGFFPSAVKLAKSNNIELWDEDKLIRFLNNDLSFSLFSEV